MESENKSKQKALINEDYIMSIMAGNTQKPGQDEPPEGMKAEPADTQMSEKPLTRERPRTRKSSDMGYGQRFLNTHSMTRRGDKSIYIRQEYHERLSRIVQVMGEDKIPLYAYLDNILEYHFEQFEKAITEDFNEKFKPIF